MGVPTRALQNFFVFQRQRCNDKKFQAPNPNLFSFIHHQTLNPFLHQIEQFVLYWKLLGGGLQMLFEIQKQMNNV
jgi:hypothetical protein